MLGAGSRHTEGGRRCSPRSPHVTPPPGKKNGRMVVDPLGGSTQTTDVERDVLVPILKSDGAHRSVARAPYLA